MVSSAMIKHEMSGGLMPSVLTTATTTTTVNMMQMDNSNHSQIQLQQQQQQQIVNKNQLISNSNGVLNNTNASTIGTGTGTGTTINSPKMGSRRIFTPQFKLQVLESYRNDNDCKGNQRATARKYNIHRRQIQKWLQCESNLRSSVANINQSQVKHQFHNITPNTAVTTTQSIIATTTHNSQFVSQQQQQQQQHYQQQQQQQLKNNTLNVPSTPTSTTTPCTAAGVLVAANFAAAVAAAASASAVSVSMANVDTATTTALAPIRPTAIVGSDDVNVATGGSSMLHTHAHLQHLPHHLATHHHHHLHPHAHHHHHHHHPYNTLPYTHSAVPILTHHQPLYPHSAAAALLAAAHHHLPPHQMSNNAVLHHHHYQQQQQQQEYHHLQQQQLFGTAVSVTSSMSEKEPLEIEVVGDSDIGKQHSPYVPTTTTTTIINKTGNGNEYESEQLEFEHNSTKSNNNCNRVRLTAVYKLQNQPQQPQQPQQQQQENKRDIEVEDEEENENEKEKQNSIELLSNEQATITPIDLSMTGARRNNNNNNNYENHKILMRKEETVQKYDKEITSSNSATTYFYDSNDDSNNAVVVDLTFRKRKVMSKCLSTATTNALDNIQNVTATSSLTAPNQNKDDDAQPEKMPKFSAHQSFNASVSSNGIKTKMQIKQEHMSTHDVNATITSSVQNAASKPVKLFKPYLLDEEEEVEQNRKQVEEKFHQHLINKPQNQPTTETFQGVINTSAKYTFPIGSPNFQNSNGGSKPASPKSILCSPTSPIGFHRFSKGSPVSGYESSSSTYSECSSHRGLSNYSYFSEQLSSPPHLHFSTHGQQQQQLLATTTTTTQHHFQGWLDQDTQSSLATCSTRSSPTPTPTSTPTPPTTRTPPAANTSIALYA